LAPRVQARGPPLVGNVDDHAPPIVRHRCERLAYSSTTIGAEPRRVVPMDDFQPLGLQPPNQAVRRRPRRSDDHTGSQVAIALVRLVEPSVENEPVLVTPVVEPIVFVLVRPADDLAGDAA